MLRPPYPRGYRPRYPLDGRITGPNGWKDTMVENKMFNTADNQNSVTQPIINNFPELLKLVFILESIL
jgi:hypothetical protein